MQQPVVALVVTLVIAGMIVLIAIAITKVRRVRERRRSDTFEAFAVQNGFRFAAEQSLDTVEALQSLPLFKRGHSKRVRNLTEGERDGVRFWLFDYKYSTGGGQYETRHHQTVVVVYVGDGKLPVFACGPENFFHRLGEFFALLADIDFDNDAEFSFRYRLRGDDEAEVRRVFDTDVRALLCRGKDLCAESDGSWLAIYEQGQQPLADELDSLLERSTELLNAFVSSGAAD